MVNLTGRAGALMKIRPVLGLPALLNAEAIHENG
jgi:hypothetical protein